MKNKDYEIVELSLCTKIKEAKDLPGDFRSVQGEYVIPKLTRTGFYKPNGYMLGSYYDADIRELLSSEILGLLDEPSADIALAKNGNENGCFSLNILKENEKFVEVSEYKEGVPYSQEHLKMYIERDIAQVGKLPGITQEFLEKRRQYLPKMLYVYALLSNADIKQDNMQPILNEKTGEYRNSEFYDGGLSYINHGSNIFFMNMTAEELMLKLFQDYYPYIVDTAQKANEQLTDEKINDIFNNPVYIDRFASQLENVKNVLMKMRDVSSKLYSDKMANREPELPKTENDSIKANGITMSDMRDLNITINIDSKDKSGGAIKGIFSYFMDHMRGRNNDGDVSR